MRYLIVAGSALMLIACGGGGGSEGQAPAPAQQEAQPVTSVSPPNYAEKNKSDAFRRANEIRQSLGLGLVAQNTLLDTAAQNHSLYLTSNGEFSHSETPGKLAFYGATLLERINKAQYSVSYGGEVIAYDVGLSGADQVDKFMGTVYHRAPFVTYNFTDVGVGESKYKNQQELNALVMDFAYVAGKAQGAPAVPYVVWPKNNATVPSVAIVQENPDPGGKGYPVTISVDARKLMRVNRFELKESGTVLVNAILLRPDSDPTLSGTGMAALVPVERLKAATSYVVEFEGTVDGSPLSIRSSFNTP